MRTILELGRDARAKGYALGVRHPRYVPPTRVILTRAKWCASFWCHFRGLQLVPGLPDKEGVLFVTKRESRSQTTIHMFFMLFSIGVVWLDSYGNVLYINLA